MEFVVVVANGEDGEVSWATHGSSSRFRRRLLAFVNRNDVFRTEVEVEEPVTAPVPGIGDRVAVLGAADASCGRQGCANGFDSMVVETTGTDTSGPELAASNGALCNGGEDEGESEDVEDDGPGFGWISP